MQIDVFDDFLTFAGNTGDQPLTTSDYNGILGVIIMSLPGTQFKWAKAYDNSVKGLYVEGFQYVQFSHDGTLIVASLVGTKSYIMLFNSIDGSVKSSRTFAAANVQLFVGAVLITSAPLPKAYSISNTYNYNTNNVQNQLFSFDASAFSSAARWAKTTISDPYLMSFTMAISFGSSENIIYVFSQNSGSLQVFRIDDSGITPSIQWTYGFLGKPGMNFIKYKNLDSSKEMIALAGSDNVYNKYFGVLIIPTASPYIPISSNIYYSTSFQNFNLQGIFIENETSIKALFYRSQITYLTTFTLSGTPSFSYQQTLPFMPTNIQTSGVFSNDGTKYFVCSYGLTFYTNNSPSTQILHPSVDQSVIYSSDVTSADYILSDSFPYLGTLTVIINGVTDQLTSFYVDQPGLTFADDPNMIMRDLNLLYLNQPIWSRQEPFSIYAIPQANSILTFQPQKINTISLSIFAVTHICGSVAPELTYYGIKPDGLTQYNLAQDNISVNSTSGEVTTTEFLAPGNYMLIIKGVLQNKASAYQVFSLKSNYHPIFNPPLKDQIVEVEKTLQYHLPPLKDADAGQTLSIEEITMSFAQSFLTYDNINRIILFSPTLPQQVGNHIVSIKISDQVDNPVYSFMLTVNPKKGQTASTYSSSYSANFQQFLPSFSSRLTKIVNVPYNTEKEYSLPLKADSTDLEVIHLQGLPQYATFEFPTYKFSPVKVSHLGIAQVKGVLKNSYGYIQFQFNVNVDNQPPNFKQTIQDQKVLQELKQRYQYPKLKTEKISLRQKQNLISTRMLYPRL